MKTATVRELRSNYSNLLMWLGAGENILITRRGKPLARLIPEPVDKKQKKVDWTKSAAFLRDRSKERVLTAKETADLLSENKGRW